MIKAYKPDIRRVITTTPKVDVTAETILAKVYKSGEYQGIANTVRPDPEEATANLNITNGGGGAKDVVVKVLTKYRYEDEFTEILTETISVAVGTADYQVLYDQEDKEDVKVLIDSVGNCLINSLDVQQSQFNELEGLIVGGSADEPIDIPCDFRRFEPGDDYTIVFEASNYGVIGRDIMILFANDGLSTDAPDS